MSLKGKLDNSTMSRVQRSKYKTYVVTDTDGNSEQYSREQGLPKPKVTKTIVVEE